MILIQWQITSFYCDAMDRMRGELLDAANVGVWHFRDITTCSGHFRFRGPKRSCGGDHRRTESDPSADFHARMRGPVRLMRAVCSRLARR